jgi:hypothetical protein
MHGLTNIKFVNITLRFVAVDSLFWKGIFRFANIVGCVSVRAALAQEESLSYKYCYRGACDI